MPSLCPASVSVSARVRRHGALWRLFLIIYSNAIAELSVCELKQSLGPPQRALQVATYDFTINRAAFRFGSLLQLVLKVKFKDSLCVVFYDFKSFFTTRGQRHERHREDAQVRPCIICLILERGVSSLETLLL